MSSVAPTPRQRRRLWVAIIAIAVLALVVGSLGYLAQPQRATRLILEQVGSTLGLEISASGGTYRLSPTPSLVVQDVIAREPGGARTLLRADRVALSLPWSTIRSRGSDLTIDRVEADKAVVDVAALQHWLQRRPPGKARIPVLTRGLEINEGTVVGTGWTIASVHVDLPFLAPARRVQARASGRYRSEGLQVPFSLAVTMSSPSADTAIGVAGEVSVRRTGWSLPARIVLSARVDGERLRLERMKFAADAHYVAGATRAPFAAGVAGTLWFEDGMRLEPAAIAVRASGLVPALDASGKIAIREALDFTLDGALQAWPTAWPELPPPLGQSQAPLPFRLRYAGASDLSSIAELALKRDDAMFDGRFRPTEIADWIGADEAIPLPPLEGRFQAPRLDIAGAQLQGVDITFDDPQLPPAPARPGRER